MSYLLKAALRSTLAPEIGPLPLSYTRAATGVVWDNDGMPRLVPSNCARFTGARFVQQLVSNPSFDTWAAGVPANCTRGASATFTQVAGRAATGSALRMSATNGGNVGNNRVNLILPAAMGVGRRYIISAWVRRSGGTSTGALRYAIDSTGTFDLAPVAGVDGTWRRFASAPVTVLSVSGSGSPGLYANVAGEEFEIDDLMIEDITSKACVMPSEWVSKGALAFPYSGAGADGVQFFATANGNTWDSATQRVTEAAGPALSDSKNTRAYISDANGHVSTPTNALWANVSSVEMIAAVRLSNWASAAGQAIVARDPGSTPRCFILRQTGTARQVDFTYSLDGVSTPSASVVVPFLDGEQGYIRVLWAAGGTAQVGYSRVGISGPWTMGGSFVVAAGTLFDSGKSIQIGQRGSGTQPMIDGWVSRALIYLNGALAHDFNSDDYVSGNSWNSLSTGETYTFQGRGASVQNFPMRRYLKEKGSTNLAINSVLAGAVANTTAPTAWTRAIRTTGGTFAPVASIFGLADGAVAFRQTATADGDMLAQTVTIAANTTYTWSVYVEKVDVPLLPNQFINIVGQPADATFGAYSNGGASITGPGRIWITMKTVSAGTCVPRVGVGVSSASTGDITWSRPQFEAVTTSISTAATMPTSFIPTTTTTIGRNEDVLAYPLSVFSDVEGTAYARAEADDWGSDVNNRRVIGDGNVGSAGAPLFATAAGGFRSYDLTSPTGAVGSAPSGVMHGASTWSVASGTKIAYSNGVFTGSAAYDGSFNLSKVGIGTGGSFPFQGHIGDVILLDTALSIFGVQSLPDYSYPHVSSAVIGATTYPAAQGSLAAAPPALAGGVSYSAIAGAAPAPAMAGATLQPSFVGAIQ